MSERHGYEPGVPCWVENLQDDPETATSFYAELFGWEFAGPGQMPGDPPGATSSLGCAGGTWPGSARQPAGAAPAAWNTHVSVDSVEDALERVRAAGGTVVAGPFDAPPAGRGAIVQDPAGGVLCVWEPAARHGAQLVNEPSAWAMSLLQSTDPDAATAFYEAVFGWQAESFGEGVTLWRLPGYVGGEPQQPVPRDVVAAMCAAPQDAPGSFWSVDFWIDDAGRAAHAARSSAAA